MMPIEPPASRSSMTPGQWILAGMGLAWAYCLCVFPLYDTDFWWHLRTGDLIRETGTIPRVDLFSSTHAGEPWIDLHWGFQVLVSYLYQWGQAPAVILFKAAIYTLAFSIVLLASRSASVMGWRRGSSLVDGATTQSAALSTAIWLWLLPIVAMSGRALERPEMLSILFLGCTLAILVRAEEFPRRLALLPLLFLVWINCHALFVLGAIACCAWLAELVLRWSLAPRYGLQHVAPALHWRWVAGVAAASIAVLFINPWGVDGVLFPLTLYRKFSVDQTFYSLRVGEFQTPWSFLQRFGLANVYLDAQLVVMGMVVAAVVAQAVRGRARPWQVLLTVAFFNLAWEASRNVSPFCIVSGFVLVQSVVVPRPPDEERVATDTAGTGVSPGELLLVLVLMLSGAGIVSGLWNDIAERNKPFEVRESRAWFMHDAARLIAREGMPKLVYARSNGQASLVIYHAGPSRLVFFDPRLELMSRKTFERFDAAAEAMRQGDPQWDRHVRGEKDERPAVLLDSRMSRAEIVGMMNAPDWQLVFADGAGAVFLPVEVATRLGLPVADATALMIPPET